MRGLELIYDLRENEGPQNKLTSEQTYKYMAIATTRPTRPRGPTW